MSAAVQPAPNERVAALPDDDWRTRAEEFSGDRLRRNLALAAALVPVIEEAGGVFTDWQGRVTPFGGDSIATNDLLAGPVRSALGVPA